ncbi:hypothetical protein [Arthrobacter castelli]|uniref:hypothetical protein n=1 Tax=Arthrobacter castelli TaxID=271431 RepID=UPI000411FAC5|nr:hypothetical protein [Arthrobacter castelli]
MNRKMTVRVRTCAIGRPSILVRCMVGMLLAALLVPAILTLFSGSASAAGEEDTADYSLYQLSSNAASYFSNENSPKGDGDSGDEATDDAAERMTDEWHEVTKHPGMAGSLLGYADPEFSFTVKWLFSAVSGSSQTLSYDTFKTPDAEENIYQGLLNYAYFGAANAALGFDSMSSGIGGGMIHAIAGSVIWFAYALSMGVSWLFWMVIQILQLLNPFMWFAEAVKNTAGALFANGMTAGGDSTLADGPLAGLAAFIDQWYSTLVSISWSVLVPLFIGFLLLSLVFFKKMNRGSAIKKLVVRVAFIGLGLPLIGSMYTGILDQFDDSLVGSHAGPTRVVLSTYVDFNAWMTQNRLYIPEKASISWNPDEGQPTSKSILSVRTSTLAINAQSHDAFSDINVGTSSHTAGQAWQSASVDPSVENPDTGAVLATMGMLGQYITSQSITASDFESGIKSNITQLTEESDGVTQAEKRTWFTDDGGYAKAKDFGEKGDLSPRDHPLISTGVVGLDWQANKTGGSKKIFFTHQETRVDCGYRVVDSQGNPANCNMSPLAAYNYLNTSFAPQSMTIFSSDKATSGFTRETHNAVSQVGTGPASFMYWVNAVVLLFSIVVIGFFYAIGMLVAAIKRMFSLVAAVPFATMGSLSGISKVIIYTVALILEILVTLFLYQFVSQFLVSLPQIIEGPIADLVSGTETSIFSSGVLGAVAVVVMTAISTIIIIGVTFVLMRVRKSVLEAMDEVVTKLVDKFLETNTPPQQSGDGSGVMPAMAGGVGSAAAGSLMNKQSGGNSGSGSQPTTGGGGSGPKSGGTNAGGTNGPKKLSGGSSSGGPQSQLPAGGAGGVSQTEGSAGSAGGSGGPSDPADPNGQNNPGGASDSSGGANVGVMAGGSGTGDGHAGGVGGSGQLGTDGTSEDGIGGDGSQGEGGLHGDSAQNPVEADGRAGSGPDAAAGSQVLTSVGAPNSARTDKAVANDVNAQGGLSRLGGPTAAGSASSASGPDAAAGSTDQQSPDAKPGSSGSGAGSATGATGGGTNLSGTNGSTPGSPSQNSAGTQGDSTGGQRPELSPQSPAAGKSQSRPAAAQGDSAGGSAGGVTGAAAAGAAAASAGEQPKQQQQPQTVSQQSKGQQPQSKQPKQVHPAQPQTTSQRPAESGPQQQKEQQPAQSQPRRQPAPQQKGAQPVQPKQQQAQQPKSQAAPQQPRQQPQPKQQATPQQSKRPTRPVQLAQPKPAPRQPKQPKGPGQSKPKR